MSRDEHRMQLHLVLPYKFSPRENRTVRRYLDDGYRIIDYQRVTDREAVVTLGRPAGATD